MPTVHIDRTENFIGFATATIPPGSSKVPVLTRASLTSDESEFYRYVDQISDMFFSRGPVLIHRDAVTHFLILIHEDLSADVHVNDFPIVVEMLAKRALAAGTMVSKSDIADIRRLQFGGLEVTPTDKIIFCFKVGWKFGLFFDLDRSAPMDLEQVSVALGALYRYLSFQDVYKTLEAEGQFQEMMNDGWFPFIELLGREYGELARAYPLGQTVVEETAERILGHFDEARIRRIAERWWQKPLFEQKRPLLQAGINAYLRAGEDGPIQAIKTLYPEIEGLIRLRYFGDTGAGEATTPELLEHVLAKGREKAGSDLSLLFPLPFFHYLKDSFFRSFDVAKGDVTLSRHSSSHGVADPRLYTKVRAHQGILILDQIYWYS